MSEASTLWNAMLQKADKQLIDEPCRGCGSQAGEEKDKTFRLCHACSLNWLWLGEKPPLLPNDDYIRDTPTENML